MSTKRQAETQLGPDNWDQEEPEKEENEGFKMAPKEILEKRVIRTAKRRSQATGDAVQKPVFSGFSGFNKTQKSSFDFLANLTNGSKPNNGSTSTTDTATVSSSSMISKPSISSSPSGGIFSLSAPSTPMAKSPFGQSIQSTSAAIFGGTGITPAFTQSVFSSSKPDSTVNDNPLKGQSSVSSTPFAFKSSSTPDKPISQVPVSQVSSSLFGVPSGQSSVSSEPFAFKSSSTPDKPVSQVPVSQVSSSLFGVPSGQSSVSSAPFAFKSSSTPDKPVSQVSSSLFGVPSGQSSVSSATFAFKSSSTPDTPVSQVPVSQVSSSLFGVPSGQPSVSSATFAFKSSSTPDTPVSQIPVSQVSSSLFGVPSGQSSVSSAPFAFKSSSTPDKPVSQVPVSQVSSSLFGMPSGNTNNTLSTKTNNNPVTTPFKLPVTNTPLTTEANKSVNKDVKDEKKLLYYAHLKALNESVLAWIKKHVEASPMCILTPIFRDYEKHLKGIEDKYETGKDQSPKKNVTETKDNTTTNTNAKESKAPVTLTGNTQSSTLFPNTFATSNSLFSLTPSTTTTSSTVDKTSNFTFGINTSTTTSANTFATTATISNFTFGINASTTTSANAFANTVSTSNFTFGINTSTTAANTFATTATPSTGFSFGIKSSSATSPFAITTTSPFSATTSSPFAATTTSPFVVTTTSSFGVTTNSPFGVTTTSPFAVTTTSSAAVTTTSPFAATATTNSNNSTTPFSFGIGKPFAFNSNIKKDEGQTNENTNGEDNEDEPPKVEYTPIAEENSVYDKKCKVFVKKDGNFVDKGVGTLYIKKIEETGKHQLLVRANTSLGNVLINLILSSSLPTQRMGKNNVMMVCMPTPDSKPPPTSILIRVKTSEDADELLETLSKYKA